MIVIPISLVAASLSVLIQITKSLNRVLLKRMMATIFLAGPWFAQVVFDVETRTASQAKPQAAIVLAVLFSGVGILVNNNLAGGKSNQKVYPQFRPSIWTPQLAMLNAMSWVAYLVAYEWLFREFLLFGSLEVYPLWFALLINTVLYSGAHLHKGPFETLLCIPFGILLCMITLYTGNFYAAAAIHISLALSNDYFAIRANPLMKFSFSSLKKDPS